jgi:hypothetical protein
VTGLRLNRMFAIGAAAVLVAGALVALAAILRGDFSDTEGRILATLVALLFGGATLLSGLALVERDGSALGWATIAVAIPGFALCVYAIWSLYVDGGGDDPWQWGWTGALALLAALLASTAQLLARSPRSVVLAWVAGALAVAAAAASIIALWRESSADAGGKVIAVLWILGALAFFLVPVLQRFAASGRAVTSERVLAELDGVELVATHARDGAVRVDLEPGERLLLRRVDARA